MNIYFILLTYSDYFPILFNYSDYFPILFHFPIIENFGIIVIFWTARIFGHPENA